MIMAFLPLNWNLETYWFLQISPVIILLPSSLPHLLTFEECWKICLHSYSWSLAHGSELGFLWTPIQAIIHTQYAPRQSKLTQCFQACRRPDRPAYGNSSRIERARFASLSGRAHAASDLTIPVTSSGSETPVKNDYSHLQYAIWSPD